MTDEPTGLTDEHMAALNAAVAVMAQQLNDYYTQVAEALLHWGETTVIPAAQQIANDPVWIEIDAHLEKHVRGDWRIIEIYKED